MSTRDYYYQPPVPGVLTPGTLHDGTPEEEAELRRTAERHVLWERAARNQISLAWHALDTGNYAAARAAFEQAAMYIRVLDLDERERPE